MTKSDDSLPILEKNVWNTKQIVIGASFLLTALFSLGGVYSSIANQTLVDARQDKELKKIDEKLDKKVYNSDQLTYRLNSGQTKIINEVKDLLKEHSKMINEEQKNNVRESAKTDYILAIVKEMKDIIKELREAKK